MKKNKIIICMTTIPSRINLIEPILKSLLNQCVKPDKIYINVPYKYKRFKEKLIEPSFIKEKFKDKVELFYLDNDYGPATKFIGSLLNKNIKNNDLIVITDDDVTKVHNWLRMLLINHKNNQITGFVEKELGESIIWGYLGYIFRKDLINVKDVIKFYSKINNECFLVDDHWFTGYCHYRKIPIYNIPIATYNVINTHFEHGGSNDSLVNIGGLNSRANASNKCRSVIKKEFNTEFPFWCCLGCCNFDNQIIREGFGSISTNNSLHIIYVIFFILILLAIKYLSLRKETIITLSIITFLIYTGYPKKVEIENFQNEIPKIVIQTYYNKFKIPNKVFDNIKKFAPEYKHIIFDDNECIDFLNKYFDKKVVMAFNKLQGAHKADLFRYCYLYKFGGIYLDIKTELIVPLKEIFVNNYTYSVLSIISDSVYQGIIATLPYNQVFLKLIDFMIKLVDIDKPYHYDIFTIDCFDKINKECEKKLKVGLNKNINSNNDYYLFREKCSRNKNDCYDGLDRHKMCCYVFDNNKKIFKTRYSDFPW